MDALTIESLDLAAIRTEYDALRGRGLRLDLTRGKPAPEQLDLVNDLLSLPGKDDFLAADGTDCRNYGGLAGLPELRAIFSEFLQVPADQLLALGNSSLTLMHDCVAHALLFPLPGCERGWRGDPAPRFVCPVPGYDRHFSVCEKFGIEMVTVPMLDDGPDMDAVESLVAADPRVKGMWCVPKYSNPDGACYSDETVRRLASMPTAADDFRLFWDNAYAVHSLTPELARIAPVLELCERAGHPDRAFVFGSTSKITYAGAGVAFFGSSRANIDWFTRHLAMLTIGPDKVNQLRHARLFRDADGVLELMARHRAILAPKFELADSVLREGLTGIASWSAPKGGYFMTLHVPDGCAAAAVRLAAEAGIALTPAGATHPYRHDPRDRTIRLAPSYPSLTELGQALRGLVTCVRIAVAEAHQ